MRPAGVRVCWFYMNQLFEKITFDLIYNLKILKP